MTDNTLKIAFKRGDEHREAARERLRRAEAGESGDTIEQDAQFILNFEEFDEIAQLMRTSNLELIEAIVTEQPESIRQTATVVDRDYREVHRNLKELESLGVIEFDDAGQGKRSRLRSGADTVDFAIQFPDRADRAETSEQHIQQ